MSLQDAVNEIASLGPKGSGNLIRAQDWNTLITALGEFGATLVAHDTGLEDVKAKLTALEGQLTDVTQRADDLESRLDSLQQSIQPLLDNYVVTLACDRQFFASGEICEITARVTDLTGQPLPSPFPWLDFVSVAGKLRAKAGFVTRGGSGDNALSVQVNAQGIAQVQLRAEHSEGFSELEEAQIGGILAAQVPGANTTIAQAFMNTSTPSDPIAKSGYKLLHQEYERSDSVAFRAYTDTYHVRTPEWNLKPVGPSFTSRWRDNRATVIALAKPDADPTTADGSRGAASIQVTFRDWIGPWAVDYFDDFRPLRDQLQLEYGPIFQQDDVLERVREKLGGALASLGVIGRKKYLQAVDSAFEVLNPGSEAKKQTAKQQIRTAVAAQRANEIYATASTDHGAKTFDAHIEQSKGTDIVAQGVQQVSSQVEQTAALHQKVDVLEGRMQSAERVGQQIHSGLTLINDNVRAINPLDSTSLKASVLKISADIAAIKGSIP